KLLDDQLVAKQVVLEANSKIADLNGRYGEVRSHIIQTIQEQGKRQLEFDNMVNERNLRISSELKENLDKVNSLREEVRNLSELEQRTVIKAPINGTVYNLKYNTIGGVVGPGQPILQLVPKDDQLIIEAQLKSNDIDVVHLDQIAKVQFTAFKARFHPRIVGKVTYISADVINDQQQQQMMPGQFYTVQVTVDDEELAKFSGEVELKPGMPAVAFIITGSHSFTEYFLAPIIDGIYYTFREQ
ncbi:MAG: HlyD family type I secretion periplasmic adaptor subunit, partial [Pseudomonadota bacterium]